MTWRTLAVGSLILSAVIAKLLPRKPVPPLTLWQHKQIAWSGKLNHPDPRTKRRAS